MKKYSLMYGCLGNGVTVCNREELVQGDYKKIAHIDSDRNIKFYEDVPQNIKDNISKFAESQNPNISATQDIKVFNH